MGITSLLWACLSKIKNNIESFRRIIEGIVLSNWFNQTNIDFVRSSALCLSVWCCRSQNKLFSSANNDYNDQSAAATTEILCCELTSNKQQLRQKRHRLIDWSLANFLCFLQRSSKQAKIRFVSQQQQQQLVARSWKRRRITFISLSHYSTSILEFPRRVFTCRLFGAIFLSSFKMYPLCSCETLEQPGKELTWKLSAGSFCGATKHWRHEETRRDERRRSRRCWSLKSGSNETRKEKRKLK